MDTGIILKSPTGLVRAETGRQTEMFADILYNNPDPAREPALVAGATALDKAMSKMYDTQMIPSSPLSSFVKRLFDEIEV